MQKILFQGDSITDCSRDRELDSSHQDQAFGQVFGTGYAFLLASQILAQCTQSKIQIINRGIGGHRIVDLYARWRVDCLNLKPDVLSILIGINDVWHTVDGNNGVDTPRFTRIYKELLEWTQSELPDCAIILGEPFTLYHPNLERYKIGFSGWKALVQEKQQAVQQLATEFQLAFIPYQTIFDQVTEKLPNLSYDYWLYDGVHPTAAGHYLMAENWLQVATELKIIQAI